MATAEELRQAVARLGLALVVLRVDGEELTIDGLERPREGLVPIAIVWDQTPAVVRARIRAAIARVEAKNQAEETNRAAAC